MTQNSNVKRNWKEAVLSLFHPRVITMLFFGFSAGIPILLIFSSLSLWLREAGVERSAVTFFSWAALGYSFKFVWAPLIDKLPIPFLTRLLGHRRAWILAAQFSIISAILWMASTNPAGGQSQLSVMALAAVMLGFSSATQDIVIDAYRIESAGSELQAMMASAYIAGYRMGMLVAGAGALFLASYFGSEKGAYNYQAWHLSYSIIAATMLIGVITTLFIHEPEINKEKLPVYAASDYLSFLFLFVIAVTGFIITFYYSADVAKNLKGYLTQVFGNKYLAHFLIEIIRLGAGLSMAVVLAKLTMMSGFINLEMVRETFVEPVRDFPVAMGHRFHYCCCL